MKLRIARKIMNNVANGRCHYTEGQIHTALDRYERTATAKDANVFWNATMWRLGVVGRAEVLAGNGAPGMAFDLLMRVDESEWETVRWIARQ